MYASCRSPLANLNLFLNSICAGGMNLMPERSMSPKSSSIALSSNGISDGTPDLCRVWVGAVVVLVVLEADDGVEYSEAVGIDVDPGCSWFLGCSVGPGGVALALFGGDMRGLLHHMHPVSSGWSLQYRQLGTPAFRQVRHPVGGGFPLHSVHGGWLRVCPGRLQN